jgi:fatty acid desaturase
MRDAELADQSVNIDRSYSAENDAATAVAVEDAPPVVEDDLSDEKLRAAVRAKLPTSVFRRSPWRLAWAIIPAVLIAVCAPLAMRAAWYFAIPLSIVIGHSFAMLMFFAHEIAHGAVTGSRLLQNLVVYPACSVFCISPRLWRTWHNSIHHAHANVDPKDPDSYGTMERYRHGGRFRKWVVHNSPGSGSILSPLCPFVFFIGQSQGVLWADTRKPEFKHYDARPAKIESVIMMLFWITVAILTGWRGALYLVAIPMMVANFMVMIYIFTNHLLRPLTEKHSSLDGTMSVTTLKLIDRFHFHFSHHIEHHLFPSMGSNNYPLVRQALQEIAGDRYLAPSHTTALRMLYSVPRVYGSPSEFLEPRTGRRVQIASVEQRLLMD